MLAALLALSIAVADQVSKYFVRVHFAYGEPHAVIPGFFDLTYVRNTGAAWGMLGGQNAALTLLSIVLLAVMVAFRRSYLSRAWEHRVALGLLVGGVVGNLLDRIRLGWVTDFIDLHIGGRHWPAFNIADSAICIGAALYILSSLWIAGHPLHESRLRPNGQGPAA